MRAWKANYDAQSVKNKAAAAGTGGGQAEAPSKVMEELAKAKADAA
jgi:hypothetical protein